MTHRIPPKSGTAFILRKGQRLLRLCLDVSRGRRGLRLEVRCLLLGRRL